MIYKTSVRTSLETHYASTTRVNLLMLYKETVAVYCENHSIYATTVQGKTLPVTGRGGLQGCETSSLPYFLDNRLTGGDQVSSLMRRQLLFTVMKIPGTHFCSMLKKVVHILGFKLLTV
jgi:hypothetical protein